MAGPWEKYGQAAAPQGDPVIARDPYKASAEARAQAGAALAQDDQAIQREQLRLAQQREVREAKKDAPPVLSEEDRLAVREESRQKIRLIDSLTKRSKDGWFATGFGAETAAKFNGTTAADVSKDVTTVAASGALQRIMEMARNNGGKNPLTPLSNTDFQALGQSIANLDPTQSDEQFQRNLKAYRDIYIRAFKAAGGKTNKPAAKGQGFKFLGFE